jgi:putative two-component system response regulator
MMPHVNGLEILAKIRAEPNIAHTPILMLTASDDEVTKQKAFEAGATDFLSKPVKPNELIPRVRNALSVKAHHDLLNGEARTLERMVSERTEELLKAREAIVHCLARAAEYRDNDTGYHVLRVGAYVSIIARQLGMDTERVEILGLASLLHDVGKIGIPDSVLLKPGKLDPEEYEIMQKHCALGKRVFEGFSCGEYDIWKTHIEIGAKIIGRTESPLLDMATTIALTHHEKWDGSGYPLGLAGEDIPLEGRITAVADVFDALSSKRPYKPPFPCDKCFAIMQEESGKHFDPAVLAAFIARKSEIIATQIRNADVD